MQSLAAALALALLFGGSADMDGSGGVTAGPDAAIELLAIDFEAWEQVLRNQRGSIAVVDVWASWCAPCIERFPHMVAMHHRYRDRGVQFLSLNLDEAGDTEALEWAEAFLRRVGAVFPNYHLDENMLEAFSRLDLLALPVVLIYGRDGAEAFRLTGDDPNNQFDEGDVEAALLALVGREAGGSGNR